MPRGAIRVAFGLGAPAMPLLAVAAGIVIGLPIPGWAADPAALTMVLHGGLVLSFAAEKSSRVLASVVLIWMTLGAIVIALLLILTAAELARSPGVDAFLASVYLVPVAVGYVLQVPRVARVAAPHEPSHGSA